MADLVLVFDAGDADWVTAFARIFERQGFSVCFLKVEGSDIELPEDYGIAVAIISHSAEGNREFRGVVEKARRAERLVEITLDEPWLPMEADARDGYHLSRALDPNGVEFVSLLFDIRRRIGDPRNDAFSARLKGAENRLRVLSRGVRALALAIPLAAALGAWAGHMATERLDARLDAQARRSIEPQIVFNRDRTAIARGDAWVRIEGLSQEIKVPPTQIANVGLALGGVFYNPKGTTNGHLAIVSGSCAVGPGGELKDVLQSVGYLAVGGPWRATSPQLFWAGELGPGTHRFSVCFRAWDGKSRSKPQGDVMLAIRDASLLALVFRRAEDAPSMNR